MPSLVQSPSAEELDLSLMLAMKIEGLPSKGTHAHFSASYLDCFGGPVAGGALEGAEPGAAGVEAEGGAL